MKNWKKLLVNKNLKIKEIFKIFEKNQVQIVFIVNNNKKILGSVTDGDIRRAILKNQSIESYVEKIMNKKPIISYEKISEKKFKLIMKGHLSKFIPLIDKEKKIKYIYSKNDFNEKNIINNPVVIMAGGFGLRLRPLTNKVPKPMVKINGVPILEKVILDFISYGFNNFYISVNYLSHIIKDYFGNGKKLGVSIKYLEEKEKLGTAGSLYMMKNIKNNFFVINGDLVSNLNYLSMLEHHIREKSFATVAIRKTDFRVPYGVIINDNSKICKIEEKPVINYNVNCGIYIFSKEIIRLIKPKSEVDMPSLIKLLINKKKNVSAFSVFENWNDIADLNDLKKIK